jgi:hypothetical protein
MASSNEEDDDDDDDEDDDDAGNEDYFNDDYTYRPGFKSNTLNSDSNYENLADVDQFMADVEELRSEQVYYNPDEDEDDDEYIAENNENDDEYHNSLNKDIGSTFNEEYADDDDDDANFHAYLQEYVSKYEQQEQDTEKKSELLSFTEENNKSGSKSKHHHHHHHHRRHHHHHHHHHNHKRRSSKHTKHRDHKKTAAFRDQNKLYNYLLARRLAEKFKGQCKLFQPAIPKIKPCSKSDACLQIQTQAKERKHKRKHRSKNNETEVASEKEPKGNIPKKRKFKKDKQKSEDNINMRKNSKLNESLAEENSNSNQPGTSSSFNAKQPPSVESTNTQANDKESSSLLKWIVKRAVSNTNITGASSSNASKLNEAASNASASGAASAEAKTGHDSSSKKSLIEQIRKKAAFLTETKLLDKVSISSSNYDDYDLNNLNESQFNKLDEGDELTYDEISQFTNENSSLNSKQGLSIQDEAESAHIENNIAARSVTNESSNLFKYDSIDSLTSASGSSSSASGSSSAGSKMKSNNSSVYLSYENDDYNSSSSSNSSFSSSSSLITSLSIRSASLSSHSSDSLCSSYFSSSSCSESSSPSSDYDDNDLMFNNEVEKSKVETSSAANINDNDEEALKLLERRYLRKKKEKSSKKSKFSIRKALKKRLEPKEAKNTSEQQRPALNNNEQENNNNTEHRILTSRKVMREQRLLEKVANLGSSPINVIQAIAAKALNFKLKNSLANSSTAAASTNSPCDANDTDSKASLAKYNRLLRHYKFLKSTNIKMNKLDESGKTKLGDNLEDNDDEQEIYNEKMVNDIFAANKSNEDELAKLMDQDDQGNGGEDANSKRLKEIEVENEVKNEDNNNNSQQASALINNEALDVDMEAQANQPGTSKSFSDQNQHNLPSNLFSALKEWMSKRVDSLSSGTTSTNMSKSMSYDESKKLEQSELISDSKASSSKLNKRKTRNKLKTIKTMSSFSISTESAESLASNKSMKSESPSSSSSTTFDSFNSIIETNSMNKIFEEKFQQIDSANNSTELNSTAKNTSGEGASSTLNDNADAVELNESSSNTQSTDYVSLKQIKFKKKLEKMKKHTKSVSESHDGLLEEQNDTNSLNRAAFRLDKAQNKKVEEKKCEKRVQPAANKYKLTDPSRSLIQTINLSQLQHLSLRNLGQDVIKRSMLNSLLKNFKCLKYLDISNCCTNQLHYFKPTTPFDPMRSNNLDKALKLNSKDENNPLNTDKQLAGGLDGLVSLAPTLTHLIMADLGVEDIQANLSYLLKMKRVAHLDVSNCREKLPLNAYKNPSLLLGKLAFHLSSLRSLDISGTNLGGSIIFKEADEIDYIKKRLYEDLIDDCNDYQRVKLDQVVTIASGISGLMFLNNEKRVLDFLGFFGCDNSLSSRSNIPALRIAGEEVEKHLYTSLETFMNDRPLFLLDALNHLFELYRDELIEDKLLGGHLIMNTMEKHLDNSRIQISGSASLFYVLKYSKEEDIQLPPFYLKRLIKTVINGMEEHIEESAVSLFKYLRGYIILFIIF